MFEKVLLILELKIAPQQEEEEEFALLLLFLFLLWHCLHLTWCENVCLLHLFLLGDNDFTAWIYDYECAHQKNHHHSVFSFLLFPKL